MSTQGGAQKTCFVLIGFGEKVDYHSNPQRVLNLDRTYDDIIEPAVIESGFRCIRADQIIHSHLIDRPVYELLLNADLVIADLSTSNPNVIYELGVRHALRPHTTIVMAERAFSFPFDIAHFRIIQYEHLGKEIGYREAMRLRAELKKVIATSAKGETDSPVYLFLPQLLGSPAPAPQVAATESATSAANDKSAAELIDAFHRLKNDVVRPTDWLPVIAVLDQLRQLRPTDSYIVQQLALATYKSRQPDTLLSLHKALAILEPERPETSFNAETVGLWGAIHKRLFDITRNAENLNRAIRAYSRGYFIKDDYYNGINFAFLLNVRAANSTGDDAITDRTLARRTRAEVIVLCDAAIASGVISEDDRFWVNATKAEALLGLGLTAEAEALQQTLIAGQPSLWMIDSMKTQLQQLAALNP